jgi:hypothetical protein
MAKIDFPTPTFIGQIHAPAGVNKSWKWDGTTWVANNLILPEWVPELPQSKVTNLIQDIQSKADRPMEYTMILLASGWAGIQAPYVYTIPMSGITADTVIDWLPATDITIDQLQILQDANVIDGGNTANTVRLRAWGNKPPIDIPVRYLISNETA